MGHFEMSEGTPIPDYHCVKSRFGDRSDKDFVVLFSMFTINRYVLLVMEEHRKDYEIFQNHSVDSNLICMLCL